MTKIFKTSLMALSIAFGLSSAYGYGPVAAESVPSYCSPMSKNPRCWEGQDYPENPRPAFCPNRSSCGIIASVERDKYGHYHCKSESAGSFSCHSLVQEFGANIQGLAVKISVPYIDGCHVPGACGRGGCVAGYGAGSLDSSCR